MLVVTVYIAYPKSYLSYSCLLSLPNTHILGLKVIVVGVGKAKCVPTWAFVCASCRYKNALSLWGFRELALRFVRG